MWFDAVIIIPLYWDHMKDGNFKQCSPQYKPLHSLGTCNHSKPDVVFPSFLKVTGRF